MLANPIPISNPTADATMITTPLESLCQLY
jgi:hypothetical protein